MLLEDTVNVPSLSSCLLSLFCRVVYEWDQSFSEVNMYVPVPPGVRAKELYCDLTSTTIKFGLKPNPPYLQVLIAWEGVVEPLPCKTPNMAN